MAELFIPGDELLAGNQGEQDKEFIEQHLEIVDAFIDAAQEDIRSVEALLGPPEGLQKDVADNERDISVLIGLNNAANDRIDQLEEALDKILNPDEKDPEDLAIIGEGIRSPLWLGFDETLSGSDTDPDTEKATPDTKSLEWDTAEEFLRLYGIDDFTAHASGSLSAADRIVVALDGGGTHTIAYATSSDIASYLGQRWKITATTTTVSVAAGAITRNGHRLEWAGGAATALSALVAGTTYDVAAVLKTSSTTSDPSINPAAIDIYVLRPGDIIYRDPDWHNSIIILGQIDTDGSSLFDDSTIVQHIGWDIDDGFGVPDSDSWALSGGTAQEVWELGNDDKGERRTIGRNPDSTHHKDVWQLYASETWVAPADNMCFAAATDNGGFKEGNLQWCYVDSSYGSASPVQKSLEITGGKLQWWGVDGASNQHVPYVNIDGVTSEIEVLYEYIVKSNGSATIGGTTPTQVLDHIDDQVAAGTGVKRDHSYALISMSTAVDLEESNGRLNIAGASSPPGTVNVELYIDPADFDDLPHRLLDYTTGAYGDNATLDLRVLNDNHDAHNAALGGTHNALSGDEAAWFQSIGRAGAVVSASQTTADSLAIDCENSILHDDNGSLKSVDWDGRWLYYTNGSTIVGDWSQGYLYDTTSFPTVKWFDHLLTVGDATNNPTVDWDSGLLKMDDGTNDTTLDWFNRNLDTTDGAWSVSSGNVFNILNTTSAASGTGALDCLGGGYFGRGVYADRGSALYAGDFNSGSNYASLANASLAATFGDGADVVDICGTEAIYVSPGNIDLNSGVYKVAATQVVTSRQTGWGAPTGTADRNTFATGTVTLSELAERVKALIDDLTTHGLIGT